MSSRICDYFKSSIGRKALTGLMGLGFSFFILAHMLGNLLIFVGPEAYNRYGHALMSNKLIYVAELGLVVLFLGHAFFAIWLAIENRRARPAPYAVQPKGDKAASAAAKTMIYGGVVILVFVVLHLVTFKYGTLYRVNYDGVEMRDLHRLVVEVFQSPAYVAWYILCLLVLGLHLSHGFASSFQSLGLRHPKYTPFLKKAGIAFAVIVTVGFISQPLYVFFYGA